MMKIKVKFGEVKLVVPCGNIKDKVSRLIEDVNKRLQLQLGDSQVRVKELRTGDGFLINGNDIIGEVLTDDSIIIASDYNEWVGTQLPLLSDSWHKVSRYDYVEKQMLYVEIGRHKHNKIFIRMGKGTGQPLRLELFDVSDLSSFSKAGKALLAREQTKNTHKGIDSYISASFLVSNGKVTAAELAVKATSDFREQIEVIEIKEELLFDKDIKKKCEDCTENRCAKTLRKAIFIAPNEDDWKKI